MGDPENSDIDEIRRKLVSEVFVEQIKTHLIPRDILANLVSRGVTCVRAVAGEITRLDKLRKHEEACQLLIDTLCETEETNWFQAFVESLEHCNFRLLACLLKDETLPPKDYPALLSQVGAFKTEIEATVRLENILSRVYDKGLIDNPERDEVRCEERELGNTAAVSLLISYIHCRHEYWFKEFIKVLVEADYRELAEKISGKEFVQELYEDCSEERMAVDQEDGLCQAASSSQPSSSCELEHRMDYVEQDSGQKPLGAGNEPCQEETTDADMSSFDVQQSVCSAAENDVNVNCVNSLTEEKKVINKNIVTEYAPSEFSVEDNTLSIQTVIQQDVSVQRNTSFCGEIEELHLRGYQNELAADGLEGKNVIICAPTGCGKTHVALQICKSHLEDTMEAKVIFFCNQVALVDQQCKAFRHYVDSKIIPLTGYDADAPPMVDLLKEYDVILMTPQILIDNYKWKGLDSLFNAGITLMVFDECHHTNKGHPYNVIMGLYLDEKLARGPAQAPQIVGLTASLGVGKANDLEKAMAHIIKLCANLDCDKICTVQENEAELENHVSVPHEDIYPTAGRPADDKFIAVVRGIMQKIEQRINAEVQSRIYPDLQAKMTPPSEKGSARYTQWASAFRKAAYKINEQSLRRKFLACINHLMFYNDALIVADSSRAKDALSFLNEKFEESSPAHFDANEEWVHQLFADKKNTLEALSQHDTNPKLERLRKTIMEAYRENPDSHGIVFVKTRALSSALVSWMNETNGLSHLNPEKITGSTEGMTQRKQVNILDYFKKGKHKVLIATSVAEEGLDIRSCNLVIRYLHVTNEIAMVQARGRARADDSQYVVVAAADSGTGHKEAINIIREAMMHKAVKKVKAMTEAEFKEHKERFQQEAKTDREISARMIQGVRNAHGDKVYQLRCCTCQAYACLSTDFRSICDSHHAIPDDEFMTRVKVESHPQPKDYGEISKTGKVFCKECHCDWGIQILHKKVLFPVLKIMSFCLLDEFDNMEPHIRKWKDAPFHVVPLSVEDLKKKLNSANAQILYSRQ